MAENENKVIMSGELLIPEGDFLMHIGETSYRLSCIAPEPAVARRLADGEKFKIGPGINKDGQIERGTGVWEVVDRRDYEQK